MSRRSTIAFRPPPSMGGGSAASSSGTSFQRRRLLATSTAAASSSTTSIPWQHTGLPFTSTGEICYQKGITTPHDFLDANKILVITSHSHFSQNLSQICWHYRFQLKSIPRRTTQDGQWVRDYYLCSYNNSYIVRDKNFSWLTGMTELTELPSTYNRPAYLNMRQQFMDHVYEDTELYYRVRDDDQLPELQIRRVYVKPNAFPVAQAKIDIEGGNMFQAINRDGIPKVIIGHNGRLTTAFLNVTTASRSDFDAANHIAKAQIAHALDIEENNVVFVPQWAYHLDCMLAYVGNATFLVHSFAETERILREMNPQDDDHSDLYDRLIETAILGETYFESSVIDVLIQRLTEQGFTVIKCMGVLFHSDYLDDLAQNPFNTFATMPIVVANFLNSVSGVAPTGRYYCLTNDCSIDAFKFVFSEFMRRLPQPMEVYYCEVNSDFMQLYGAKWTGDLKNENENQYSVICDYFRLGILNPSTLLLTVGGGGLRCQTNMYYDHEMPEEVIPPIPNY